MAVGMESAQLLDPGPQMFAGVCRINTGTQPVQRTQQRPSGRGDPIDPVDGKSRCGTG
ncbi:hypothetical protein D3C75_1353290 [compost metagenome]